MLAIIPAYIYINGNIIIKFKLIVIVVKPT